MADCIAHGGGASVQEEKQSFLNRAKPFIKGSKIELKWGDNSITHAVVGSAPWSREVVRYLSQSFVERLCSEDYHGASLAEEIEKVIFGHLDPTDTLNASSFGSLRALRTSELVKGRSDLASKIKAMIEEDETLRNDLRSIPKKKDRIDQLAKEAEALQKQIPKAESKGEENAQKQLKIAQEQLLKQQSVVATQKQLLLGIDDLTRSISRFDEQVDDFNKELSERASAIGIDPKKITVKFEVVGLELLDQRRIEIDQGITHLESGEGLQSKSIAELTKEITTLEELAANDKSRRTLMQALQKSIQANSQETQRLQKEIFTSENATKQRQDKLRAERLDAYKKIFALWQEEQETLQRLYKPVQDRLRAGDDEERQLDFYIRWKVDLDSWIERGEELFDQRRGHPFESAAKFKDEVEAFLVPAWESGDSNQVKLAMDEFLGRLKTADAESFLRQSVSHARMLEWVFGCDHISLAYGLRYHGTEIEKLSPGTKGIVLLILYLAMDTEDSRPLIIDQPEENLDNESIYNLLARYFRKAKQRRQVIIITHNPNLVVNTDAEQVIIASASRDKGVFPEFSYQGGALENVVGVRKHVCSILEGGERAFLEREKRYALSTKNL